MKNYKTRGNVNISFPIVDGGYNMRIVSGVSVDSILNRVTYQLKVQLINRSMTTEVIFDSAIQIFELWLEQKLRYNPSLIKSIKDIKKDVSEEYGGITLEITYMADPKTWAFRYKQPDSQIPARTWITQALVYIVGDEVMLETINMCAYPKNSNDLIPYIIPGFIKTLNQQIGIYAPVKLLDKSFAVKNDNDIEALFNLVTDPDRVLPVILLTQDIQTRNYTIDPETLASKTFGLAYIITLPYKNSKKWSMKIGKRWAPYDGAVRTYLPNISLDEDELFWHPFALREKIKEWIWGNEAGDIAFINFLQEFVKKYNAERLKIFENTNIYNQVKHKKIIKNIKAAEKQDSDEKELMTLYQEENENLLDQIKELKRDIEGYINDLDLKEYEIDDLKEERNALLNRLQAYEYALKEKNESEEDIPIMNSWESMYEWCLNYLPNKIIISSKAKQAIKSAQYEDVELAYKALLLYANEYRDMKMRNQDDEDSVQRYKDKLAELGLEDYGSPMSESRLGERINIYTTMCDSKEYLMEHHIGKGNSYDKKYCLRVYATWDPVTSRVIIGSLPGHLDTRISN